MIELWTDGSYNYQTNIGAWAYIINGENVIEDSNVILETKNNVNLTELKAIVMGLKKLNKLLIDIETPINVYSDSLSIINKLNIMKEAKNRNCKITKSRGKNGKLVLNKSANTTKNLNLWLEVTEFLKKTPYEINFIWIKGHNEKNKITLNVKADKLARKAREDYEKNNIRFLIKNYLHYKVSML